MMMDTMHDGGMDGNAIIMLDREACPAGGVAAMATQALLDEVEAGPKPGLVDRFGPGIHSDMDITTFRRSATVLRPWFYRMAATGQRVAAGQQSAAGKCSGRHAPPSASPGCEPSARLDPGALVRLGVAAEAAMMAATGGINTHRGAIWTLGLLSVAAGVARGDSIAASSVSAERLCAEAGHIARGIRSLASHAELEDSNGQRARQRYGARGARDEAAAGFPSILAALPAARALATADNDTRVVTVLLTILAEVDDTCVMHRGGPAAMKSLREGARAILAEGGPGSPAGRPLYRDLCRYCLDAGVSPGGAADLTAATLFLVSLENVARTR